MWDSWATLPQVEERFYCGASCAGVYCSDHVAIAGHGWGSSKKRLSVKVTATLKPQARWESRSVP
jgi:hypothetical protein